jgi:hypothetical protein
MGHPLGFHSFIGGAPPGYPREDFSRPFDIFDELEREFFGGRADPTGYGFGFGRPTRSFFGHGFSEPF